MRTLLLLLLLARPVFAADASLEAVEKQIASFAVLAGRFEQTKTIRVLKKPLRSEGDFVVAKGRGVLWRTTKPWASLVRVSRDGIAEIKDDKVVPLLSLKEHPGLAVIGKVLFAVFFSDVQELGRYFQFTRASVRDSGGWDLSLRPRDGMLAKAIDHIDLGGARTLETLTLYEANGDRTAIVFLDVSLTRPLTKEESALFE